VAEKSYDQALENLSSVAVLRRERLDLSEAGLPRLLIGSSGRARGRGS